MIKSYYGPNSDIVEVESRIESDVPVRVVFSSIPTYLCVRLTLEAAEHLRDILADIINDVKENAPPSP